MVTPVQGDIFWVRFGRSGDSGPSGKRPAVVIQNHLFAFIMVMSDLLGELIQSLPRSRYGGIKLFDGLSFPRSESRTGSLTGKPAQSLRTNSYLFTPDPGLFLFCHRNIS